MIGGGNHCGILREQRAKLDIGGLSSAGWTTRRSEYLNMFAAQHRMFRELVAAVATAIFLLPATAATQQQGNAECYPCSPHPCGKPCTMTSPATLSRAEFERRMRAGLLRMQDGQQQLSGQQQRLQERVELVRSGAQLVGSVFEQFANKRRRDEERRVAEAEAAQAQIELQRLESELADTRARLARQQGAEQQAAAQLAQAQSEAALAAVAAEQAEMRARRRRIEGSAAQDEALARTLSAFATPERTQSMIGWAPPPGVPEAAGVATDSWDTFGQSAEGVIDNISASMNRLQEGVRSGIRSGASALGDELRNRSTTDWIDDVLAMKDVADDLGDAGERGGLLGGIGRHLASGVAGDLSDRFKNAVGQKACGTGGSDSAVWSHACTAPFMLIGSPVDAPRRVYEWGTGLVDRATSYLNAGFNILGK